ncbi:hypothetical protein PFISCL1PPCAC_28634, partial [Pristionchus fissidentatus]
VLDIYDNTHSRRTPFLGLVASNGTKVFNNDNNGETHSLDSCRLYDADSMVRQGYDQYARESIAVHIEYLPGNMAIYYKLEKDLDWQHCLTYKNIFIPNYFYLGVSASTGDLTAQQDLISLKVFDLPVDLTVKARTTMHFDKTGAAEAGAKTQTEGGKILSVIFFSVAFFIVIGGVAIILKPDLLPGSSASIDKQKRFY